MSNYNTTKDSKKNTMVLNKKDHPCNRTLKQNVTIFNESVIAQVFYALQGAANQGIETDHSLSIKDVRTLSIEQVQGLIYIYCKVSRSQDDIVDALRFLKQPQSIDVVATQLTSEVDGDTIDAIRLHYTDTSVDVDELTNINNYEDLKSELSKVDLTKESEEAKSTEDSLSKLGARCGKNIANAMKKVVQSAAHLYIPPMPAPGQTKLKPTPIWPEFKLQIPEFDGPDDSCIAIDALKKKCAHLEYQNRFLEQMQDLDAKTIADLKAEYDRLAGANKSLETSSNHFKTAADNWRSNAFENYENYEIAQATIADLRSTIMELTETLQAADGDARVSLTSRELLQLMTANSDSNDLSF